MAKQTTIVPTMFSPAQARAFLARFDHADWKTNAMLEMCALMERLGHADFTINEVIEQARKAAKRKTLPVGFSVKSVAAAKAVALCMRGIEARTTHRFTKAQLPVVTVALWNMYTNGGKGAAKQVRDLPDEIVATGNGLTTAQLIAEIQALGARGNELPMVESPTVRPTTTAPITAPVREVKNLITESPTVLASTKDNHLEYAPTGKTFTLKDADGNAKLDTKGRPVRVPITEPTGRVKGGPASDKPISLGESTDSHVLTSNDSALIQAVDVVARNANVLNGKQSRTILTAMRQRATSVDDALQALKSTNYVDMSDDELARVERTIGEVWQVVVELMDERGFTPVDA